MKVNPSDSILCLSIWRFKAVTIHYVYVQVQFFSLNYVANSDDTLLLLRLWKSESNGSVYIRVSSCQIGVYLQYSVYSLCMPSIV